MYGRGGSDEPLSTLVWVPTVASKYAFPNPIFRSRVKGFLKRSELHAVVYWCTCSIFPGKQLIIAEHKRSISAASDSFTILDILCKFAQNKGFKRVD